MIYFDEICLLENYKEILLSFKRCIQAISTFNLSENHKTISYPHLNHVEKPEKTVKEKKVKKAKFCIIVYDWHSYK